MRKLKVLWKILKTTGSDRIVSGFIMFLLFSAIIIQIVEPHINTYGDALWYTFVAFSTIGFGDLYAVTFIGRLFTVLFSLYGIFVVALVPGIVVSYFLEVSAIKTGESVVAFLDQLENLTSLSKEELAQISENVKKGRYKL